MINRNALSLINENSKIFNYLNLTIWQHSILLMLSPSSRERSGLNSHCCHDEI